MTGLPKDQKTDEHIIPRSLNGTLVIHKGACTPCARYSNRAYEGAALNNDLLVARRLLQFRRGKKSKKKSTTPLPPVAIGNAAMKQGIEGVEAFNVYLSDAEYPPFFDLIIFPPPGLLTDDDRGADIKTIRVQFFNLGLPNRRDGVTTRTPHINGPFAKMIAKIGYCYAVAERGFEYFDGSQIRDLLTGRRDDIYNFVGNVEKPESLPNDHIHALHLREKGGWLTTLVHQFASCNANTDVPTIPYEVAVGKLL